MKYSQKEIRTGAIVMTVIVVAALFFVGFTVALSGKFWQKRKSFSTKFQMSAGLKTGDLVRYGGVKVGKITDVRISKEEHGKIDIDFVVDAETPVKTDSIAYINYIGLLGMYYIELSAGTETASLLPTGSAVVSRDILQISDMLDRVDSISGIIEHMFAAIDEKVSLILTDATQMLDNVNQLIGNVNQEKVRSILDNVDQIMTTNAETIGGILRNLESMLVQLDALSGSVNSIIVENEDAIQETFLLTQELLRSGEATLGDIEEIIGLSKDDIQQIVTNTVSMSQRFAAMAEELDQNTQNIANMLTNLDAVSANLQAFTQFTDAESGADLKAVLQDLRTSSKNASLILERIQLNNESLESILVNLASASEDTSELTAFAVEKRPVFETTLDSFQRTMTHVERLTTSIDSTQVNAILESIHSVVTANAETVNNILSNLAQTTNNVNELTASLHTVVLENEDDVQATLDALQSILKSGDVTVRQLSDLVTTSQDNIQQIVENTADFSTYITELLAEIHQNRASVTAIIKNLETVSAQASVIIQDVNDEGTRQDVAAMMTDARASLESLRVFLTMLQENNARFEEFLVDLTTVSGDVSTFTAFLNQQRPDLDLTLDYVQGTAQHLQDLSAMVAGKQESLEQTLNNVEATSASVQRIAQHVENDWPQVTTILTNIKVLSEDTRGVMEGVSAKQVSIENMIVDAEAVLKSFREFSEFASEQRPQFEAIVTNLNT
jgi:phospholipid/cholesterol/gamma-HCH transport system substrate-binding protein